MCACGIGWDRPFQVEKSLNDRGRPKIIKVVKVGHQRIDHCPSMTRGRADGLSAAGTLPKTTWRVQLETRVTRDELMKELLPDHLKTHFPKHCYPSTGPHAREQARGWDRPISGSCNCSLRSFAPPVPAHQLLPRARRLRGRSCVCLEHSGQIR